MDIHFTVGQRPNKPFLLSVENKAILAEGQTEFQTTQTSPLVTHYDCTCTQNTFNQIEDKVGTLEAPALIADANAQPFAGRMNVYIENSSLKILAQA